MVCCATRRGRPARHPSAKHDRRGSRADLLGTARVGGALERARRPTHLNAHHLQPHRVHSFKRSNDPAFAAVVGLYMNPSSHAVILSIDEKSQFQALERTRPAFRSSPAAGGHDPRLRAARDTTLFAAFNIHNGSVLGRCMERHRHQEFIRFLNSFGGGPGGQGVHVILDNYAAHKHPKVRAWLARHPRCTSHFAPTSASWLDGTENFFSVLTRRRLKRGSFAR